MNRAIASDGKCLRGSIDRASKKAAIEWLKERHGNWPSIKSIVAVTAKRECKESEETRYFISSLDATDPKRLGHIVRAHWGIENNLHWVLDVTFREDDSRIRKGYGAENFNIIRQLAINLLKKEPSKMSIKKKRFKAALSDKFRENVIFSG